MPQTSPRVVHVAKPMLEGGSDEFVHATKTVDEKRLRELFGEQYDFDLCLGSRSKAKHENAIPHPVKTE